MEDIKLAERFLSPVLYQSSGLSILDSLGNTLDVELKASDEDLRRHAVVRKALSLVESLHQTLVHSSDDVRIRLLETSNSRKIIGALLDVITLEGVYPFLSEGNGARIEHRILPVVQENVGFSSADHSQPVGHDLSVLKLVANQLDPIAKSDGQGLCPILQDRCLVDLVAAEIQLAFGPQSPQITDYPTIFEDLLTKTPTLALYKSLVPLLHSDCPTWSKPHITKSLSLLPLREDGIRKFIYFSIGNPSATSQSQGQTGPSVSLDAIKSISSVLSAVPSSLSPQMYFPQISEQLLSLLDDKDRTIRQASSYVISHGILSKKQFGAPGEIGWELLVVPIVSSIVPALRSHGTLDSITLLTSDKIFQGTLRLKTLLLEHPNPGLLKRITRPIISTLWALWVAAKEGTALYNQLYCLLEACLMPYPSETLSKIIDNFVSDEFTDWHFTCTVAGEVEAKSGTSPSWTQSALLDRVDRFSQLTRIVSKEAVMVVLAYALGEWLKIDSRKIEYEKLDSTRTLKYAQLAAYSTLSTTLLDSYKDQIASHPDHIISVLARILEGYVHSLEAEIDNPNQQDVSIASLGYIAQPPPGIHRRAENEDHEIAFTSLVLLLKLLSDPNFVLQNSTRDILSLLVPNLQKIPLTQATPEKSKIAAAQCLSHISKLLNISKDLQSARDNDAEDQDADAYRAALENTVSPTAPVRAEGVSQLERLASKSSLSISVPAIALMLLSLLQKEEDSYVYLSVIRTLGVISKVDPSTVINAILDMYLDQAEQVGLDGRLRAGEALRKAMDVMKYQSNLDALREKLGRDLLIIAGRHARRPMAQKELGRAKRAAEGSMNIKGSLQKSVPDHEDIDLNGNDTTNRRAAQILQRWIEGASHDGSEEDMRIRASALSLFSVAVEEQILGNAKSSTVSEIIAHGTEICIGVIKYERGAEAIIVRRAAANTLSAIVYNAAGSDTVLADVAMMSSLEDTLKQQSDVEEDQHTQYQLRSVLSTIRKLREEAWETALRGEHIRFGLSSDNTEGELRGLEVNTPKQGNWKPKIEEVE